MSGNPRKSNGARRNANRARMKAEGRGCWICRAFGRPDAIDYSLPARHPMSFELDELVPVSKYWLGGYPSKEACALDYAVDEVIAIARKARTGKRAGKPFVPREMEQPVEF